jgi:hypothetical protein
VCRLDEQAVEFARAACRPQEHGETNDVVAQLGDPHETILDLLDRELDRIGMREQLLAIRLPVQRRPALQLDQRSLLGRPRVTNQDRRTRSHEGQSPSPIVKRARRVSPWPTHTQDEADCRSRVLVPDRPTFLPRTVRPVAHRFRWGPLSVAVGLRPVGGDVTVEVGEQEA